MQPTVMFRPSMKHRILAEPQPRLEQRTDGTLCALREGVSVPVTVRPWCPWSDARRYISLRDDDNQEVVLVKDPSELDPVSRDALERVLAEAGFLLEVTRVLAVEEEGAIAHRTRRASLGP